MVTNLVSNIAFAQKFQNKSRLNVGQSPAIIVNTPIAPFKAPSSIKYNLKSPYNQYYRDLLIKNNSENKTVAPSTNKESTIEKVKIGNVYPNPAADYATIDYTIISNFESASIAFYNLLGKPIADFELSRGNDKLKVNTSSWESGIYMYQLVINGRKVSTKKLIVNHN